MYNLNHYGRKPQSSVRVEEKPPSASTATRSSSGSFSNQSSRATTRRPNAEEESPPAESLMDILSDIWTDLRQSGGAMLLQDLNEMLEAADESSGYSGRTNEGPTVASLRLEATILDSALRSTEVFLPPHDLT